MAMNVRFPTGRYVAADDSKEYGYAADGTWFLDLVFRHNQISREVGGGLGNSVGYWPSVITATGEEIPAEPRDPFVEERKGETTLRYKVRH